MGARQPFADIFFKVEVFVHRCMHGIMSLLCCYIVVFICSSMSIIIAMANGGTEILKQMIFNKATSSDSLHNFMVVNFHHRQGIHLAFPIGCFMICFQYFK